MKRKIMPVLAALALIIIVAIIGVVTSIVQKYTPSDERADLKEYYGLANEDQVIITIQNDLLDVKGRLIDGTVYIDADTVSSYLNSRFYWDAAENLLLYTTPTDIIRAEAGSKDYYVTKTKNSENYVIVKADGNTAYIAVDYVQKYTNFDFAFYQEPNRVHIFNEWGDHQTALIKTDTVVRIKAGIKSEILTDLVKDTQVFVLDEAEKIEEWTKVRTEDGFIGYIQDKRIASTDTISRHREFEEPVYTSISKDYVINLTWHQVTTEAANDTLYTMLTNTKGLTTISPTWFSLSDNSGNITSLASQEYVNYAHQMGLEVWGLVDNFKEEVDTHQVLSTYSNRENLITNLITAAMQYNLDGINVDFESVSVETGDAFIQFIRELSIKCRNNGIVLSIDNYVPEAYTSHYNREEQGIVADYVIIMGYDEHYSTSESSGSVASIDFVVQGIERTLEEVPADKVINAIPFFTRLWAETPKTEEAIAQEDPTVEEFIPYTLTNEAFGMESAEAKLSENGITPVWNEETAQYYAEYEAGGITYKMWLEEEESIEQKVKLIKDYNLAGVASWKLGLEKASIWDVIIKYVN